jgi:hypothetical protein
VADGLYHLAVVTNDVEIRARLCVDADEARVTADDMASQMVCRGIPFGEITRWQLWRRTVDEPFVGREIR